LVLSRDVKWVKPRSKVDALSKLCFPFLEGFNFAFIATIASGFFPKKKANIGHSNNYGPNGPNRNKMGSDY